MASMINTIKQGKPPINKIDHNAFINGEQVWKTRQQHPNLIASFINGQNTGTSILTDFSGNNNHAQMSGFNANSWQPDGSLKFDGISTLITTPVNQNILNNGASIELIYKIDNRSNYKGTIGEHGDITSTTIEGITFGQWDYGTYSIGMTDNIRSGEVHLNSATIPSNYHHFLITYDKNVLNVYINKILVGTAAIPNINLISKNIVLGRAYNGQWYPAARYFEGTMKCVNFYNKALTQAEITENYNLFVSEGLL